MDLHKKQLTRRVDKSLSLDPGTQTRRELLQTRISAQEVELSKLRQELNALLPVARLPEEILVHIFELVRIASRGELQWSCRLQELSHVCRHWREVVFGRPMLWRTIVLGRANYSEAALKRSGNAPLLVSGFLSSHESLRVWGTVLEQLDRLEALNITTSMELLEDTEKNVATRGRNLVHLRSLRLHNWFPDLDEDDVGDAQVPVRPLPWISSHSLPRLQELKMSGFRFESYQTLLLPSLTQLSLVDNTHAITQPSHLFEALRPLSQLTTLEISDIIQEDTLILDASQMVHLPQLQSLVIRECPAACATLVTKLSFPISAKVYLYLDQPIRGITDDETLQCIEPIKVFLSKTRGDADYVKLAVADLRHGEALWQDIALWKRELEGQEDGRRLPDLHLTLPHVDLDGKPTADIFDLLLSGIPYSKVTDLVLGTKLDKSRFNRLADVVILQVIAEESGDWLSDVLGVRSSSPRGDTLGSSSTIPVDVNFPRLQDLYLSGKRLSDLPDTFVESLISALKSRTEGGHRLTWLCIDGLEELSWVQKRSLKDTVEALTLYPRMEPTWFWYVSEEDGGAESKSSAYVGSSDEEQFDSSDEGVDD
ncbi:hypothetical protein OE88DRAFT_1645416 [Heliocybe sulcata]|uniref:F-box domain-containing protein n=1 Tax=Heliocybe sulcata TaxID=5364 RepID=A0A5C3MYP8_9AGAM|nr:hypothetical protein OE88DRAFT_1645416 [Heliocybe sulcata]